MRLADILLNMTIRGKMYFASFIILVGVLSSITSANTSTVSSTRYAQAVAVQSWPNFQNGDGAFRDPLQGGEAGRMGGYSESMIGYALLQRGVDTGDQRLIYSGLAGINWNLINSQFSLQNPSSFENMAMASAYNLARTRLADNETFRSIRPAWEDWLRAKKSTYIADGKAIGNKYLVDVVAASEMCNSGLTSEIEGSYLKDCDVTRSHIKKYLERFNLRARGEQQLINGRQISWISEPPKSPPAYVALSAGMLARWITTNGGPNADSQTKQTLVEMVEGLVFAAAPDGSFALHSRSQEQAWASTLAVYAAQVAAGISESVSQKARFMAFANRVSARVSQVYAGGPYGLYLVPSMRSGVISYDNIDTYASTPGYVGLAAVGLGWSSAAPKVNVVPSRIPSDFAGGRSIAKGAGAFVTLRVGNQWILVRKDNAQTGKESGDLRYDFGLMAAKKRIANGKWVNTIPLRPIIQRNSPYDSAGPVLIKNNRRYYPRGTSISVSGSTVTVKGSYRKSSQYSAGVVVRSNVIWQWQLGTDGIKMTWSAKKGDQYQFSNYVGLSKNRVRCLEATPSQQAKSLILPASSSSNGGSNSNEPYLQREGYIINATTNSARLFLHTQGLGSLASSNCL